MPEPNSARCLYPRPCYTHLMTDTSATKPSPESPAGIGAWIGVALSYGMFAIAGLMGLLVLYAGLRLIVTGEQHWGVGLVVTAMGIIFASIGIGICYLPSIKPSH